MRLRGILLFIHILGVIALFGGFAMQQRAGARLRAATKASDVRAWVELLRATLTMVPSGVVMLLVTGGILAARLGVEPGAWIGVSAIAALGIGALSLGVTHRDFAAIGRAVDANDGTELSRDVRSRIMRPRTWATLAACNGAAMGTLWLMANRPGAIESIGVVVTLAVIGAIVGARLGARRPT